PPFSNCISAKLFSPVESLKPSWSGVLTGASAHACTSGRCTVTSPSTKLRRTMRACELLCAQTGFTASSAINPAARISSEKRMRGFIGHLLTTDRLASSPILHLPRRFRQLEGCYERPRQRLNSGALAAREALFILLNTHHDLLGAGLSQVQIVGVGRDFLQRGDHQCGLGKVVIVQALLDFTQSLRQA